MTPELRISMLGSLVIAIHGQVLPESIWRSRQERRLLTILLTRRGRRTSADQLIEWLWPGADHTSATITLRSAISSLRHTLEPSGSARASSRYIITRQGGYAWNTSGGADIDIDTFLALTTDSPREASEERAREAVALYRGDYLEDEPDAPWALAERDRLRERYTGAVQTLAEAHNARGDHTAAITVAQTGLRHAPLSEPLWRMLMRSQMYAGDAAGALQSYERYRLALDHELGALPSPQTQALHAAILRGDLGAHHTAPALQREPPKPPDTPPPAQAATSLPRAGPPRPLVGRRRELAKLAGLVAALRTRRGGVVALIGEAGVGKSRLAEEALREAAAHGAQPITLRSAPLDRGQPFAQLGEALKPLIRAAPEHILHQLQPSTLAQVADLLPALRDRLPQIPTLPATLPDELRNRYIDGLVDLTLQMARIAPLVIFCDDAHWADDATLATIVRLARRASRHAILIILAYRPEELADNPTLHSLLRLLGREMLLQPLIITRLDGHESAQLVAALGNVSPEQVEQLTPRLIASTGGNPLFLTVAIQALLEAYGATSLEPVLALLDAGAPLPDPSGARPIRDLVLSRLEHLPSAARELVEQLAIVGSPASLDLIEQLAGPPGLEAAQVLLERQILTEQPDRRLGFSHDLVRSIVASDLSSPRVRLLHRHVAHALAALYGDEPERAGEIAHHFERSGRGAESEILAFATAAGDHLRRAFAFRTALAHYEAAITAADRAQAESAAQAVRAYGGALRTYEALLDWDGITALRERYLRWAARRADVAPELVDTRRLILLRALTGDLASAAEMSRRQAVASGQQHPVLLDMLERTALILEPPLQLALGPEQHPCAPQLPKFLPAAPLPGDPARDLPALLGDDEVALVLFQAGWAALTQGILHQAGPCLLQAHTRAQDTGQATGEVLAALQMAHLYALKGEEERSAHWLRLSLDTAHRADEAVWASIWPRIHEAFLWLLGDQIARAEERFLQLAEQLQGQSAFESHRKGVQVGLGLTALARGDHDRANRTLEAELSEPQALYGFTYVAAQQGAARLAALGGDVARARAILGHARQYAVRRHMLPEYVRTAIEQARIERDYGDPAAAVGDLRATYTLASTAGLRPAAAAAAALIERLTR